MNEQSFHEYLHGLSETQNGAKRAARIFGCTTQPLADGELAPTSCKDATCPRCRKAQSYKVARFLLRLEQSTIGNSAFVTFTWRQSANLASFQSEVALRRRFIRNCMDISGISVGVLVAEFTVTGERIHLHYHSVLRGSDQQLKTLKNWFDAVGERNCDIRHWDGRPMELAKYFTPTLNYQVGMVLSGCRHLRIRSAYGLKKEVECV